MTYQGFLAFLSLCLSESQAPSNLLSPRQHRIPDGVHKNPAGRGFMWLQDGSTWKQVAGNVICERTPVVVGTCKAWITQV